MLRFSIRQLFAGVACVAGMLGAMMWLHRSFQIDAVSETLVVDEEHVRLAWQEVPWTPGRCGVVSGGVSLDVAAGTATDVSVRDAELYAVFSCWMTGGTDG